MTASTDRWMKGFIAFVTLATTALGGLLMALRQNDLDQVRQNREAILRGEKRDERLNDRMDVLNSAVIGNSVKMESLKEDHERIIAKLGEIEGSVRKE